MTALEAPDRDMDIVRDRDFQDRWIAGDTLATIAHDTGYCITTVHKGVKSATGIRADYIKHMRRGGKRIELDEFERDDLRRLYRQGFHGIDSLARMYNISRSSVYLIVTEPST